MLLSKRQQRVMGIIVAIVGLITIIAMTDFIFIIDSPVQPTPYPVPTPTVSENATSSYEGTQ